MKNLFILILAASLLGCATPEKKFNSAIEAGRCENALEKLPENEIGAKLISKSQLVTGKTLSYALTGLSYTAEVVLDVAGGTIMFVALCSPYIAAVATQTPIANTDRSLCFPGKFDTLFVPPIGRKTFKATENMRCPDLVPMSRSLRKVAACFSKRNNQEANEQAAKSLRAIQGSIDFYNCLPVEEQKAIAEELDQVKKT